MLNKTFLLTISVLIFGLAMSSCVPGFQNYPAYNQSGGIETAAALTVSAYETQAGINTLIAELTEASQSTSMPAVNTETAQPSAATSTTTPTNTQGPPSATNVPPKPTAVPIPCNRINFIKDVNYPDGSVLEADAKFTKTWRFENSGSCTWNPDYELVFVNGSSMGAPAAVEIGDYVSPGESIDVSVKLRTPDDEGTYTGNWMLRDDYGARFGVGANAGSPFWVKIKVKAAQVSPSSTPTKPKPTASSTPCNRVKFIKDVTYPDNSVLKPNQGFTKTWRLENSGKCTWDDDYELVFVSGSSMGGPDAVEIGEDVSPGESIDVSVNLKAPDDEGTYTGKWMLRDDDGDKFGIGADGDDPFWVKIRVEELDDISDDDLRNFAKSYKYADWRSSKGSLDVPSPENDFKNGSITRTSSPKFESGYEDDEMTLITIPSAGSDGRITGHYPAIRIRSGDRFRAIIGCIYDYDDCDVTFQLNYNLEDDDEIYNLGSWQEKNEGKVREIIVDLGDLEGEDVEFHLVVNNNGSSNDDKVFWLLPGID